MTTEIETIRRPAEHVNALQCKLESIASISKITGETCDDPDMQGVLDVIGREVQSVRTGLDDVIRAVRQPGDGGTRDIAESAAASQVADEMLHDLEDDPETETDVAQGGSLNMEPAGRTVTAYDDIGMKVVEGSTCWMVPNTSPKTIEDLRFTGRDESGFQWWCVTPADTDYTHVHEVHGRALAFEFLDMVNHPERDDERVSEMTLAFIARGMAEAAQTDYRHESLAHGFWTVICEYLMHGTANR